MKQTTLILCFVFVFLFTGRAAASPLAGTWVNTDPDTRSTPKIVIEIDDAGEASFTWWGRTHPTDSKYGPVPLKFYARSVSSKADGPYAVVKHENNFSERMFILEIDGGYLRVQSFTKFTDESKRSSYSNKMTFRQES